MSRHISNYLNFKHTEDSKHCVSDKREFVYGDSGSKVYRNTSDKGTSFQLFLNAEEYRQIYTEPKFNSANFYGANYIHLSARSHLICDICEFLGWSNTIDVFDPYTR